MNKNIPSYYIGKTHKIEARKVAEDFELTYNLGSCLKYILRAGKKEGNPPEQDIRKAINHLHFELDRLHAETKVKTGGLAQ
tara:strand:- start:111 stop:353 length:243 start_codon:yes stop_codon:yes gene_type:complete